MADLGTDVSCILDIDPMFAEVKGALAVGQAVARRLTTVNGAWFADLEYGYSLIERLNDDFDPARVKEIELGVEREALKDERVATVDATVEFSHAESRLTVTIRGTTADGPFDLVLAVSDVSVEVLRLAA